MNHIPTFPLIKRAAPGRKFLIGRTRDYFHQVYPPSDKGIHTLPANKQLYRLPLSQSFGCFGKKIIGYRYLSHVYNMVS